MSAFANTPELRIERSDSKNPATTCRGITSSGRPCRNAIRNSPQSTPVSNKKKNAAKLRVDDPADESLYCWQHKDQASISAHSSPGPRKNGVTPILEERTSIDTLADRLGLMDIEDNSGAYKKRPKIKRHDATQHIPHSKKRPKQRSGLLWCCFSLCYELSYEEPSPRPQPVPHKPQTTASVPGKMKEKYGLDDPFTAQSGGGSGGGRKPGNTATTPEKSSSRPSSRPNYSYSPAGTPSRPPRTPNNNNNNNNKLSPSRPSSRRPSDAQTLPFLRLVEDVPPDTAAVLLAELAKPVSSQDEPGYIYIFRLEPEMLASAPPTNPSTPLPRQPRDLPIPGSSPAKKVVSSQSEDTYLLKIGRATNVQRRLNEWKRQCDHEISLMRYYPYVSSRDPDATPRKVPHSHKVERLIHLQLTGLNMRVTDREKCKNCGREHKEWFEVKADRESVADLDRIVRKWSDWNEAEGHRLPVAVEGS